jgi:hypothetical protein
MDGSDGPVAVDPTNSSIVYVGGENTVVNGGNFGAVYKSTNADIEEGHKSTRLCHLGNIAFRTGRAIRFDEKIETCIDDPEANRLLGRSYRKPFVVPESV